MISAPPLASIRARAAFISARRSGEFGSQCATSPTTCSGARERQDWVGLPGKRLSVRLGSSSNAPVGSTT